MMHAAQVIVREEGVWALWKGNWTAELLWGGYMGTQASRPLILSHRIYLLIDFKKLTPLHNHQLTVYYYKCKY